MISLKLDIYSCYKPIIISLLLIKGYLSMQIPSICYGFHWAISFSL